jgi:hypothetical protein
MTIDQAIKASPTGIAVSFHQIIWVIANDDPNTKEARPYRWVRVPVRRQTDYHLEPQLPERLLRNTTWQPLGDVLSELAAL